MLSTLLTTLPPVVHIISTELEIPLTAVTVQSSVSGSPIVRFPSVSIPILSLLDIVACTRGVGTTKNHNDVHIYPEIRNWRTHITKRYTRIHAHSWCACMHLHTDCYIF